MLNNKGIVKPVWYVKPALCNKATAGYIGPFVNSID
jgi:hypothetical protein